MKRLIAYVSGNVQGVGYRARVMDIARAFGIKGMVENLKDGRVLVVADGEDKRLEWLEDAINIKNTLIQVTSIEKDYASTSGEFDDFGKLVFRGETDTRLDIAAERLGDLIEVVKDMNRNLGGKIDQMNENLGGKIDQVNENLGGKMDQMNEKQDGLLVEVRDINRKFDRVLEEDIVELKADMSEVKAALRAKGII